MNTNLQRVGFPSTIGRLMQLMSNLDDRGQMFYPQQFLRLPQYPPMNILKNKSGAVIEMACAGFRKGELDVSVKNNTITISCGQTRNARPRDGGQFYARPRDGGQFQYVHKGISDRRFSNTFTVTDDYDLDKLRAQFKDGMLRISVPYSANRDPKRVNID